MSTRNERVWRWFDAGEVVDALLGRDEFFMASVTYRDRHDDVLLLRQLVDWAIDRNRWDDAVTAVRAAVEEAIRSGDLRTAFGLAWAAVIVGDDTHERLVDERPILGLLDEALRSWDDDDPEVTAIAKAVLPRLRGA